MCAEARAARKSWCVTVYWVPVQGAVAQQVWHAQCIGVFMSTESRPSFRHDVNWASLLETAQTLSHGLSANRYVRSLVEPWPHDQSGKTIMQHLLWQCLLSTKKAISHLCIQQRGSAQEVLHLIYPLLSGWAQPTNTPYVHYVPPQWWLLSSPAVKYYVYSSLTKMQTTLNSNSLYTTLHDHRESPLGCCPTLLCTF